MNEKYKKVLIAFGITLAVTVVTFAIIFISYTQKLKNTPNYGLVTTNTINSVVDNYDEYDAGDAASTKNAKKIQRNSRRA